MQATCQRNESEEEEKEEEEEEEEEEEMLAIEKVQTFSEGHKKKWEQNVVLSIGTSRYRAKWKRSTKSQTLRGF